MYRKNIGEVQAIFSKIDYLKSQFNELKLITDIRWYLEGYRRTPTRDCTNFLKSVLYLYVYIKLIFFLAKFLSVSN